jgi:hypothetical protein
MRALENHKAELAANRFALGLAAYYYHHTSLVGEFDAGAYAILGFGITRLMNSDKK